MSLNEFKVFMVKHGWWLKQGWSIFRLKENNHELEKFVNW